MQYRTATIHDIDFIMKGIKEINDNEDEKFDYQNELNNIIKSIQKNNIDIGYINCKNVNESIGFIWYNITNENFIGQHYTDFEKDYIWISYCWILEEYRSKGHGTKLYEHIINIAKKNNINNIWLDIYNTNKKSIDFHTKLNFKPKITIYSLEL